VLIPFLLLLAAASPAAAQDWPGLWGPGRNAETAGRPIRATEVAWRRAVSGGYSEIAVHAGRAFTMEMHGGADFIVSLDAATGREQWRVRVGPTYQGHGGSDDGPISTPAVEGNDLFALGPHGQLIAIDVASGRERWRHDLVAAFGASPPTWGFAASPLIEGRLVIVPTGGAKSRGLLAFERASGKLVWNAAVARATAYSSAVPATIGGVRQIIAVAADFVYGVAPADGRVLWSAPATGGTTEVSNSAIVLPGGRVLVSNWVESMLIDVTHQSGTFTAKPAWRSNLLRSTNGPTLHRNGFLYGFAGGILVCMDPATQQVRWRERTGAGTLIGVGDELVFLSQESGEIHVATVTPDGFTSRHRARVMDAGVRAVTGPSYADGRLFVRNLKEIVALRLK
jgi:outer membrane protein assembly factor BamB